MTACGRQCGACNSSSSTFGSTGFSRCWSKPAAIAPNTVKQHAHAIFVQLGVSTRAQAVVAAAQLGLRLG